MKVGLKEQSHQKISPPSGKDYQIQTSAPKLVIASVTKSATLLLEVSHNCLMWFSHCPIMKDYKDVFCGHIICHYDGYCM